MRNRAFTIVELLAATALSTLLFVVALVVIRSLQTKPASMLDAPPPWQANVRRQLERDLQNAVVFRQSDLGFILGGYGSLDPATLAPTHLPVQVTYSLRDVDRHRWLVRDQVALRSGMDLRSTQLVCRDVQSFSLIGDYRLRRVDDDPPASAPDPTPLAFSRIADAQRPPDRMRIHIEFLSGTPPTLDFTLVSR